MEVVWRVLREPFTARAGRTFVYCFCQPVLTLASLIVVGFAIALSIVGAGIPTLLLLPPMLAFARVSGAGYRGLANGLLEVDIPAPVRAPRRAGTLGFIVYYFAEPVGWRAVAYTFVKLLLLVLEFAFGVGFRLLFPLSLDGYLLDHQHSGKIFVLFCAVLFWVAHPLTELILLVDLGLIRRLLGPSQDSLRIRELEQTRTNVINEASATLRRIERDLHDGAQARLVALGIRLGRAQSQFERGRTEAGLALLRESRAEAKEIVEELRDLVRGILPPALEAGLEPALATLAARTPISTVLRVRVPARLPAAAETTLYFAAAELITNAAKHSGANTIAVSVFADALGSARLIVTDDGRGGAHTRGRGSGLRGLADRVRGLDGRLTVDSPEGGPTTAVVELPAQGVHDAIPQPAKGH